MLVERNREENVLAGMDKKALIGFGASKEERAIEVMEERGNELMVVKDCGMGWCNV